MYEPVTIVNGKPLPSCVLCTLCMDRGYLLTKALESWIRYNVFEYMIIVDWFSRTPLIKNVRDVCKKLDYNKAYVVRALDKEMFYISKARNLAMRFMRSENIKSERIDVLPTYSLIIDSDVKLINYLSSELYCQNGFTTDINKRHLCGTVLLPTTLFWKVNGYMEIITYGYSDVDFYRRLQDSGFSYNAIDMRSYLSHIPHIRKYDRSRVIANTTFYKIRSRNLWIEKGEMEMIDVEIYYPDGSVKTKRI